MQRRSRELQTVPVRTTLAVTMPAFAAIDASSGYGAPAVPPHAEGNPRSGTAGDPGHAALQIQLAVALHRIAGLIDQ